MRAGYITVNPESDDSYTVEIEEGQTLPIGRKPSSDRTNKLVLPVPEVSAQHAEIRGSAAGLSIIDSGSTNGTRLNGEWLVPGKEYALSDGDHIKIAQVDLLVWVPESTPKTQSEDQSGKTQFRIDIINATILVADIRGFSTLMERYAKQPEVVMQATQSVFRSLSKEVSNQKGQLEKIAGDAIMAYWQETTDQEPGYASRACYAALRLQLLVQTVLSIEPGIWPFKDFPLQIDIALATGPVAAGALGQRETNPALLGDTANLAFRMEKLIAQPGDIVVDGITYNLVRDQFQFSPLGQFQVKGRQQPVDLFRLLELRR